MLVFEKPELVNDLLTKMDDINIKTKVEYKDFEKR